MSTTKEYRFTIGGFTPDTLPTAKLAEYLTDLAIIFGETSKVHFVEIQEGSAVLVNKVEHEAIAAVERQLKDIEKGTASKPAMKAYRNMNNRLRADKTTGSLGDKSRGVILQFPGVEASDATSFGPFNQPGTLDGKIILVGGTNDPVPVHLQQGAKTYNCRASRQLAVSIAPFLFSMEIRVSGRGQWTLDADGNLELMEFLIDSFEVLEDISLKAAVARLRDIAGGGLKEIEDPWSAVMALRNERGNSH